MGEILAGGEVKSKKSKVKSQKYKVKRQKAKVNRQWAMGKWKKRQTAKVRSKKSKR